MRALALEGWKVGLLYDPEALFSDFLSLGGDIGKMHMHARCARSVSHFGM